MNPSAPKSSAYAWCLFLGGMCFLGRTTIALLTGPPPSTGTEILKWIEAARGLMMWSNEALVIGAGLLLVGLYGVQKSFQLLAPMTTTAGSMLFFAALVVCFMLGIVQGRFVYPIHGLSLTRPEDAELLASLFENRYLPHYLPFAGSFEKLKLTAIGGSTKCGSLSLLANLTVASCISHFLSIHRRLCTSLQPSC